MGFLKRVLGGPAAPASTQVELNVNYFAKIRDDAVLQVVGESYRQENVALARPPGPATCPTWAATAAGRLLQGDADPRARQRVRRECDQGDAVGGRRLDDGRSSPASSRPGYQPLFRHLGRDGSRPAIACDAALVQEGSGRGVVLHLGTPGECIVELITDDRAPAAHSWAGKAIVITGRGKTSITGVRLHRYAQLMLARWAGVEVLPRLTKKTDLLVIADPNEASANVQRAREYGVATIDEPDWLRTIGIPPRRSDETTCGGPRTEAVLTAFLDNDRSNEAVVADYSVTTRGLGPQASLGGARGNRRVNSPASGRSVEPVELRPLAGGW